MYIPIWLIAIAAIVGIYFFNRSRKNGSGNLTTGISNMGNIFKQPFSYRLDITIDPNWNALYKKAYNPKSEKEWKKITDKKGKELEKSDDQNLFGRHYHFTEYYDSVSGLTTRFQKVRLWNGAKHYFYSTDEFGDRGYFFESDSGRNASHDEDDKTREARKKLSVEVGEDFIRNDIFDKHIGGARGDWDYEKENYLFRFPLHEVFNFLFALGTRFHDTERRMIIKWPDEIEKKFKECGIKYETIFDYEPDELKIQEWDKDFYEKWGKPKVSNINIDSGVPGHSAYLCTDDHTYYGVTLKIFRPGENDRIAASR